VIAQARLVGREPAATGQVRVSLAVDGAFRAAHVQAGQFVELFPEADEQGYFALLHAPGEQQHVALLVRTDAESGGEAAALLMRSSLGAEIPIRGPLGAGFALERALSKSVRVVATGTAIAPARAAIVALGARGVTVRSLDYGVRSGAHVALGEDLASFRRAGIEVAIHVSLPEPGGARGALAQDALAARWTDRSPHDEVVVAVGQPELARDVRARWRARGGDPLDVLTNL
jgi:NAD(P)H-flavin reductase